MRNNIYKDETKTFHMGTTFKQLCASKALFKVVMGHVGSGKTTDCCFVLYDHMTKIPVCTDGIRRARTVIARNTYKELKLTTVKTWLHWFNERRFGRFYRDSPFFHEMKFTDHTGTPCEFEIYFLSLDSEDDVKKLLSLEATFFWFNEIREFPYFMIQKTLTRLTGRYPTAQMLGVPDEYQGELYYQCLLGDTNPPRRTEWIKTELDDKPKDNFLLIKQAPAMIRGDSGVYIMNPNRENKLGVRDGDFLKLVGAIDDETFKVYVLGEYANVWEGKPVHPGYKTSMHFSQKLVQAIPQIPIYIGWDFGLTPACAIGQYISGQLRILHEFCTENSDLEQFLDLIILPFLHANYGEWLKSSNYVSTCDPSGIQRAQTDGSYCLQVLDQRGILTSPAYTNESKPRQAALDQHLNKMHTGEPCFIVSNNCIIIDEALNGGYHYKKIHSFEGGEMKYSEVPNKNKYSHIAEAVEYLCMPLYNNHTRKELDTITVFENGTYVTKLVHKN